MNCTEDRETIELLRDGTAHLVCEPPTAEEIEAMLAEVPRERERTWSRWAVAAAALVAGAVIVTTLERPERGGPPTEHVQAPVEEKKKPEPAPEPPVTFTFEDAWKAADHLWRTRRWDEAVTMYEKIVTSCRTEEEVAKHAPRAQMRIGECRYRQQKYHESYRAYDAAVLKYTKIAPEIAADAAYYRYRAATALFAAQRNQENEKRKKEAREAFARDFPDHPRAIDLNYYAGADRAASGDALSAAGQAEDARRLWELAIVTFRKVKPASTLHEKALARIGETLYKLGRTDEALVVFRRVLDEGRERKTTDPQRRASRRGARAIAVCFSARCHRRREAWKEVLAVLADFETTHGKTDEGRPFVSAVKVERMRAFLALDRVADATKEAEALREKSAKSRATTEAARLLGRHLFDAGKWEPAAEWLEAVVAGSRGVTADDLAFAGLAAEKTGNLERAEERLAAAVTKRQTELAAVHRVRDEGWVDVDLATYREALARVRKALGR
ncbi:MAG: tetratricopeptide repeat protein [Planctomycetota bacterium]